MTGQSLILLIAVASAALAGCDRMRGGGTVPIHLAAVPSDRTLDEIPLGPPPGAPQTIAVAIRNPLEGDAQAVQQGKTLFGGMNCVYCHGPAGAGLIGPALNTPGWRYGGTPAELYRSIHDGRPKGMPAWGGKLPPQEIWKLVAYIESLGGAEPPATAQMVALGGGLNSTTGPEPADQLQTDTAHQGLEQSDRGRRR